MDSDWQSSLDFMSAIMISVHRFCSDVFVAGSYQRIKAYQYVRANPINIFIFSSDSVTL